MKALLFTVPGGEDKGGVGWGCIHDSTGLADWWRELNKFFLLGTLSNKSFLTSPMNTLPASLID